MQQKSKTLYTIKIINLVAVVIGCIFQDDLYKIVSFIYYYKQPIITKMYIVWKNAFNWECLFLKNVVERHRSTWKKNKSR